MRKQDAVVAAVAALAAVGVVVAAIVLVRGGSSPSPPPAATQPERSTSSAQQPPPPPALVVKVDNVAAARPHTGIGAADKVYVEPVEGGLTRLAAVYTGSAPAVIGPVRSARETDVQLLAAHGRPALAYSGVAPELRPLLAGAPLKLASPEQAPGAYFRENGRPSPHNLYFRPAKCPQCGLGKAVERADEPPPDGGEAVGRHQVNYRAATFVFSWSQEQGRWLVSMNGTPMTSTDSGRVGAGAVVVQHVETRAGHQVIDATGNPSPVVKSVGSGKAVVLRDGERYDARWSRQEARQPTSYTTPDGEPIPLGAGPVWTLLVPR